MNMIIVAHRPAAMELDLVDALKSQAGFQVGFDKDLFDRRLPGNAP